MKKYIIIFFFLFFYNSNADTNINFIDVDKAINLSKPGKSILKQLDKINKENKSKIIKEEEIIKTKENS